MAFYFKNFPKVQYDLKKNNKFLNLTNVTLRFKLTDLITNRSAIFYDYSVKESDRPDIVAFKYYGDEKLDWLILLTNQIIDPYYDWPLNQNDFNTYIINKYDSIQAAESTVHHYEQIIQAQSIHTDGSIIPEKVVRVDETTYNTLEESVRRSVSNYENEINENEEKRQIKILEKSFVPTILSQSRNIFK